MSREMVKKIAEIITVDMANPAPAFSQCREVISAGGVIAYPTETFYALGVDPKNPAAVRRLFAIKGRNKDQPILVLIADASDVHDWAVDVPPQAKRLMTRFWPGPLTLVFRAKAGVLPEISGGTDTVGVRMPGNALTRDLIRSLGHALTGTSANISGRPGLRSAQETVDAMGSQVDLVLDGGTIAGEKPSTVVDVSTEKLRVIREGAIPSQDVAV